LLGLDSSRNEIYLLDSADNETDWWATTATMFLIGMHAKDEVTSNACIRRTKIRTRDRSIDFGMNADVNNRLVLIVQVTLLLAATTKKIVVYAG